MSLHQAFRADAAAVFVDRPNRFLIRAALGGEVVEAHCPNPGRLSELLFPGVPLVLEKTKGTGRLAWTAVAVRRPGPRGGAMVPLVSARANAAVGDLVLPSLFPGARQIRPEFTLEDSRFDFLVDDAAGGRHLVEVKACSEVEYGTGLFPDAPSLRAVKHLEHLAFWGDRGYRSHVVFALVHGRPRAFGPNAHTDPVFARTLKRLAPRLNLHAVVLESDPDGATRVVTDELPFDWTGAEAPDEGLLVRWERPEDAWKVRVEAFPSGWAKACAQAPARQSFGIRCAADRAADLAAELAPLERLSDPRWDPALVDTVMRWRHASPSPPRP